MLAVDIEIGGVYMSRVGREVTPIQVLRTYKSDWHKTRRTVYVCRVLDTGIEKPVKDVKRFRRPATAAEIEHSRRNTK